MHGYRDVIAIREVWTTLLLAALIRIPIFSLGIVMSVHVVSSLHLDYVRAGAVTTVVTVATMISGPWRGSMVDRRGLRRTMLPSLITTTIAWGLCPWLEVLPSSRAVRDRRAVELPHLHHPASGPYGGCACVTTSRGIVT